MTNKKIALLTMYYDSNYGGNLQRYALITTLQRLGYDVTCLCIRQNWTREGWKCWIKKTIKQVVKHYLLLRKNEPICLWKVEKEDYLQQIKITEPFYEKYIPHTEVLYGDLWLKRYAQSHSFDAYMVGSDQVWRKPYVKRFGLGTWFFDFLPNGYAGKRIAYGASFGVDYAEYDEEEQKEIRLFYERFNAVSVREQSGLNLLQRYGWNHPQGECVIDPTLLLQAEDYNKLINAAQTQPLEGKLLCYVLDNNAEKEQIIKEKSQNLGISPTIVSIGTNAKISVEQWLRNFRDAEFVITDSYHGVIFSLIYHKQFRLVVNQERGASRFESLTKLLEISLNEDIDWAKFDTKIDSLRNLSLNFLQNALQ